MPINGVLLDIDDTLYPYHPCNEAGKDAAWEEARDRGYDLTRDEFESFYMEGKREVNRQLAGTGSAHERFLHYKRAIELFTGTHNAGDALALTDRYWDVFMDHIDPFDGVHATLQQLRGRGLKLAAISDHTTHIQLRKVRKLGVGDYLDYLVTSQETGRDKPSAVMFTNPLAELDLKRSEVVMLGNSLEADIAGANAVGITTVLFNNTYDGGQDHDWEEPDEVIDAFPDLIDVIDRLGAE